MGSANEATNGRTLCCAVDLGERSGLWILLTTTVLWAACGPALMDGVGPCARLSHVSIASSEPSQDKRRIATLVPRETIPIRRPDANSGPAPLGRGGVYAERSAQARVNGQPASLLVAHRPVISIRPAVTENAPRIRPPGTAVTGPRLGHGDEPGAPPSAVGGGVPTLSGCSGVDTSFDLGAAACSGRSSPPALAADDPEPAVARAASAFSPDRAPSIIPSKSPRTETPRRAASASTHARRSWSSRIPTTVDLLVAMTR